MLLKYYGPTQVTKSVRIAACLATSLKESKARGFISGSWLASATPALRGSMVAVLFRVHVDPRGETEWDNRVKHAHLVENSLFKDEFEYLFAPYSVFTVRKFSAPAGIFVKTSLI